VRRSGVDMRDERRTGEKKITQWLLFKGRRGTPERGGGSGDAMRCRAVWGLAPTGGRRLCFGSGAPTRLTRGPRLSVEEGVRRERRERTWAGPEKRGVGQARMNSNI
jgi:hypothetical protein